MNTIHKKYKENNTKECHYQIVKTWYKDKNLETAGGGVGGGGLRGRETYPIKKNKDEDDSRFLIRNHAS